MRGPVELIQYLPRPAASPAGLTRGSILFASKFLRRRWIAGSSPAMTAETGAPLFRIHSTEIRFRAKSSRSKRADPSIP
jgi:hypothetical protein